MSTAPIPPLDPGLIPRLILSSRSAPAAHVLSRSAIRLSRGIFWEPAPQARGWQHRHTLCPARAEAEHLSHKGSYLSHASAALWPGLAPDPPAPGPPPPYWAEAAEGALAGAPSALRLSPRSPSARSTTTTWPSATRPARIMRARASPISRWTRRRSGRAP